MLLFVLPFLLIILYLFAMRLILSHVHFLEMSGLMGLYFIPPAGKESVIPIAISLGIPWYTVGFSVAILDILTCLFLIFNFDLILKVPVLGEWMVSFISKGRIFFGQHKWMERLSIVGLMLCVMVPLQGTGGIGSTVLGIIMGLPRRDIFIAITLGSLFGSFLIAAGSNAVKKLIIIDIWLGILAILGIILLICVAWIAYRWYQGQNS
jgi:uncharacterized membrane protein